MLRREARQARYLHVREARGVCQMYFVEMVGTKSKKTVALRNRVASTRQASFVQL